MIQYPQSIHKSISVIHHIYKLKNKNHTIMSIDAEWYSTLIYDKTVNKDGIEGPYLNIIKTMYDKPTANTTLTGES